MQPRHWGCSAGAEADAWAAAAAAASADWAAAGAAPSAGSAGAAGAGAGAGAGGALVSSLLAPFSSPQVLTPTTEWWALEFEDVYNMTPARFHRHHVLLTWGQSPFVCCSRFLLLLHGHGFWKVLEGILIETRENCARYWRNSHPRKQTPCNPGTYSHCWPPWPLWIAWPQQNAWPRASRLQNLFSKKRK